MKTTDLPIISQGAQALARFIFRNRTAQRITEPSALWTLKRRERRAPSPVPTCKMLVGLACIAFVVSPLCAAEISLASAPPVVVKTVPPAGATDVDPSLTEIKVTYSKAMQDRSWSWCWWENKDDYPETTGDPRYLQDSRTCVLPVKLQPNKFYAVWLNSDKLKGFTDTSGRPAVPYLLTFYTGEATSGAMETAAKPEYIEKAYPYRVQAGDTLSTIASSYRAKGDQVTAESILKANPGLNASALKVGQKILIPVNSPESVSRKFVRLVVAKDEMTFEGEPITRDQLEGRMAKVPDRAHTVLEVAATPDLDRAGGGESYMKEKYFEIEDLARQLSKQLGFEYLSRVGLHRLGSKGGQPPQRVTGPASGPNDAMLNDDQRAVLAWTDRQFRSFFDRRTFDGWSADERATLERKLIDSLKGPRTTEYYQAINTLAAMRSTKALPALREIAYDRREKDNRDRWMAIRAIGMLGGKSDVPELIPLVYHGNSNTRWWAQISLVRLTGQNFGKDWNAWGEWWNDDQNGQPPYKPEIIRWWSGQPDSEKLAVILGESDQKFLSSLKPNVAATKDAKN